MGNIELDDHQVSSYHHSWWYLLIETDLKCDLHQEPTSIRSLSTTYTQIPTQLNTLLNMDRFLQFQHFASKTRTHATNKQT